MGVDTARDAYYFYRQEKGVSAATEAKVKSLYLKYQQVMRVAEKTYRLTDKIEDGEVVSVANEFILLIKSVTANSQLKEI